MALPHRIHVFYDSTRRLSKSPYKFQSLIKKISYHDMFLSEQLIILDVKRPRNTEGTIELDRLLLLLICTWYKSSSDAPTNKFQDFLRIFKTSDSKPEESPEDSLEVLFTPSTYVCVYITYILISDWTFIQTIFLCVTCYP